MNVPKYILFKSGKYVMIQKFTFQILKSICCLKTQYIAERSLSSKLVIPFLKIMWKSNKKSPITFLHHCIKLLLHILLNTSGWISGDAFWRQPGVPNSLHFPWPSTFNFADFSHYWSAQTIDGQIPFSHTSKTRVLICISFGYRTHHNGVKIFMDKHF